MRNGWNEWKSIGSIIGGQEVETPPPAAFFDFWLFCQSLCAQKTGIFEIWAFWVCPQVVWPQKSEFSKFELFAWLLLRKLFFLLRSSLQLPRLRLGPLKGFLSWLGALQGPSTRLVRCFRNVRERGARTPATCEGRGAFGPPPTLQWITWLGGRWRTQVLYVYLMMGYRKGVLINDYWTNCDITFSFLSFFSNAWIVFIWR